MPSSKKPYPLSGVDRLIHEPARFDIIAHLYVVDGADFLFLQRQTGMTWGNLSPHISKLEDVGYIAIEKDFVGKKPYTMLHLTDKGRTAFSDYRAYIKNTLDTLQPGK